MPRDLPEFRTPYLLQLAQEEPALVLLAVLILALVLA